MKFVPNAVSSRTARALLVGQKHSPAILFGAGIVGFGATVVLASRATLKLDQVIEDTQKHIQDAKNTKGMTDTSGRIIYSEEDYQKDAAQIYILAGIEITKLYGPALVVGVASVSCLAGSHNILNKRNAGLTAAYAALEKGFKEYRQRVLDEVGEEKEERLYYGSQDVKVMEEGKDGKSKEVVKHRVDPSQPSIYARFFDELSPSWRTVPEYNHIFLNAQQNWANDKLRAQGHLFLNEVYDSLGLPRSKAGAVVGWVISKDGDNFVDFNVFDGTSEKARDFVNGYEGAILLDFNVDGVIYDKI